MESQNLKLKLPTLKLLREWQLGKLEGQKLVTRSGHLSKKKWMPSVIYNQLPYCDFGFTDLFTRQPSMWPNFVKTLEDSDAKKYVSLLVTLELT